MKFEDAKTTEAVFTRRTVLLGAGAAAGFVALGARLYHIQVIEADEFALKSQDNQFNYRLLTPSRGRLLDRFDVPLAENEENYTVVIIPENARDPEAVLDRLATIAPLTDEKKQAVMAEIRRAREFDAVTVMENLSWRDFSRVNLHAPELPGVLPIVGETRFYPLGATFAHITGYVGKADPETAGNDPLLRNPNFRVGREGMERALDHQLRGEAGWLKVEVDAHNRVVRELPDPATAARQGDDIRLTLDASLQQKAVECLRGDPNASDAAKDVLSGERTASCAVIDVRTGDILALASHPAYDPNHFAQRMSSAEYKALSEDPRNPLFPWATAGEYPPGSTFKTVIALASQRYGVIGPTERVRCGGVVSLGRARFHCWKAHGSVDLHDAIKGSCDIYFYETARRLGINRIAEVAREFGLGAAPDIQLPGVKSGLIPDEAWKRAVRNEPWTTGDSFNAGIGQGFVSATPLQLAVMTARIASKRKVVPRLILPSEPQAAPEFEPMDFPDEVLARLHRGMRAVCQEQGGTAHYYLGGGLNYGDMEMAGKSGTSQVARITAADRARGITSTDDLPWNRREHALFIGFAPFDAPRYACAVVVQHGIGGSRIAGPMVRDVLVHALQNNSGRSSRSPLASLE